jgi:hypothetical protein
MMDFPCHLSRLPQPSGISAKTMPQSDGNGRSALGAKVIFVVQAYS